MSRRLLLGFALLAILATCSCGSRDAPTLTREQLLQERLKVNVLYLTEDGREIIAPSNRFRAVVDPKTNKLAWAAWQCDNPNCPGKGKHGRPFLFPRRDPFVFVKEDGTVGCRQPESKKDIELFEEYAVATCPACSKTEVRQYVLPESAARLKELEEAHKRRIDQLERRKNRKP